MNTKKPIKSKDLTRFLQQNFSKISEETKRKQVKDAFLWTYQYDTWIDVFGSITEGMPNEEAGNSMLILRLLELQKSLTWLQLCVMYGSYRPLIRELRFIMESFMQAYYLDKSYPQRGISWKLELLSKKERELFGSRLIDKLDLSFKKDMKKIYQYLSKYQHSTYEELKPSIIRGNVEERILPTYDKTLFNKCKNFTNKVLDIVFYLSLKHFDHAILKFKKRTLSEYWLKELESNFTLKLLNK